MRCTLGAKYSKVEIMENYWDKMLGFVQKTASDSSDKKMLAICQKILLIPKDVKKEMLLKYIIACCELSSLAFFQWRIRHPTPLKHEIEELR